MSQESETLKPPVAEETGRNPVGWVVLAILLILTFAQTLGPSGKAAKPSRFVEHEEEQTLLRTSLSYDSLLRAVSSGTGQSQASARQSIVDSLDAPISSLVLITNKDPMAAMLYATMRTFQKQPVPADHLQLLAKGSAPEDRAFYEIYTSKALTLERARQLTALLPKEPFVYQVAKVQALEKAGDRDALTRLIPPGSAVLLLITQFASIPAFGICIAIWYVLMRRLAGGTHKFLGLPLDPASLLDADRMALRAAQIFAVFMVLYAVAPYVPIPGLNGAERLAVAGVMLVGVLYVLQQIPISGKQILMAAIGVNRQNLGRNVLLGVVAFIAEFPVALFLGEVSSVIFKWLPKAPENPAAKAMENAHDWRTSIALVILGAVVAPIWEETVFRGLIFPGLKKLLGGIVPAALLSSFLFASVHNQGPTMWLPLGFLGCASCFISTQSRSLVPSIVMHALHNFTIFVLIVMMK